MIFPVPEGVNPNTHRCGNCSGRLKMPWREDLGGNSLECVGNPEHDTYQKKYTGLRTIGGREYDIMTQRETTELAPITDHETALATVNRAVGLGLFPDRANPEQLALLAQVALAYRLDPLMGEIMPYQGQPYITIKGRRRLDNAAGHLISISHRPPTVDEEAYWLKKGAIGEMDIIQICVGTDTASGAVVEGFGRVKENEGKNRSGQDDSHLPLAQWKVEMAQKRAERRMREIMFGPVAKPEGLDGIAVLQEGDEEVVEAESRLVPEVATTNPLPDLGNCIDHGTPWKVEERFGRVVASHREDDGWCKFEDVYKTRFTGAWRQRHGFTDDDVSVPAADVNQWLKANFNGKTWSKMDAQEQIQAVTMLTTLPDGTESSKESPQEDEPSQPLPTENTYQDSAEDAETTISQMKVDTLIQLAQEGGVTVMGLMERINEITGDPRPEHIPNGHYDAILAWVNQQVDAQIAATEH